MKQRFFLVAALLLTCFCAVAADQFEPKPIDPYFKNFYPLKAPKPRGLILKKGDQVAICGDSITEQKMYSRIVETYLTVCVPELNVTVRQFGWSGEKADGFLARMTNDVLRFHPNVTTTCYGMNDHLYRRYEEEIGQRYLHNSIGIVEAFKANGVRVIQGSPGCIGVRPGWSKDPEATSENLNLSLCKLRNIGIGIAQVEKAGFADVFWPMFLASHAAKQKYGANYEVPGKDGVHPGWAGHLIMAYAFLKSMGLNGDIGAITVDLNGGKAKATSGHEIISTHKDEVIIRSSKYPFCAAGPTDKDDSIRSGMMLVPFNETLNRFLLVVKGAKKDRNYSVTWGSETKTYTGEQLAKGVNLAADFQVNPFSDAFKKVDEAVAAKQNYETKQIKQIFRSPEAKTDMEGTAAKTEKERAPLAAAIHDAFKPVTHMIRIVTK